MQFIVGIYCAEESGEALISRRRGVNVLSLCNRFMSASWYEAEIIVTRRERIEEARSRESYSTAPS